MTIKYSKCVKYIILFALAFVCAFLWCKIAFAESYADVIDAVANVRKESIYDIKLNAPYTKDTSGVREVVNPENGALTVSYNLFTLKGMSGDVQETITLEYNNRNASNMEETVVYNDRLSRYENTTGDKSVLEQSMTKFGIGWQISMPHIEIPDDKNKTNTYVYMPDGRVFKAGNTPSGLEGYELEDVKFSGNAGGEYTLKYVNGDVYKFNSSGFLDEKSDKYGNVITYTWSNETIPSLIKVSNNWGDTVNFDYTYKVVTVSYKGRKYLIHRENDLITSIVDPHNRVTKFEYQTKAFAFNFFNYKNTNLQKNNIYYLLNNIIYNNGLQTRYEYTTSSKWLYEDEYGFIEYSKISARYDLNTEEKTNRITYEYKGEPDGFPKYRSKEIPNDYQYTTVEKDSLGTSTIYKYNNKHYQTSLTVSADGKASSKEVRIYDELTKMPKEFQRTTYYEGGASKTEYELVEFDKRGNVTYRDVYTDTQKAGKEVYTYQYSYGTNMCIYESYMKDENTKIEKRRTLNYGGSAFASETIYENGRQIKKDEFEYNDRNKLTMSKVQTSTTDYLITKYTYDGKYSFKYPTRVVVSGVRTADGDLESYVTEYEYDDYGNCTKVIDNNQNTIKYTYDNLDRKTKEILEDGKAREYIYDDRDNTLTTINANGLKLLYFYDKCGKLVSVYDTNEDKYILLRTYDDKERLTSETDANGTKCVYTYDNYDRYTSLVMYDKDDNIIGEKYIEYDDVYQTVDGTFLKMTLKEGQATDRRITEYMFDHENRLSQKHLVSENGNRIYRYEYDYSDNVISEISPSGLETTHDYDFLGNVVRTVYPDQTEEYFEYDFNGNCITYENAEGEKVYYTYDSLSRMIKKEIPDTETVNVFKSYYDYRGNTVKEIGAEGNISIYTYNPRGLLETSEQYATATEGTQAQYEYDGEGNLCKMSYGDIGDTDRITHTYTLDIYGRCIEETDNEGNKSYYEYDSLGNITYAKDRNGIVTESVYDGLSRCIEQTNSKSGKYINEYNDFGNITCITDGEKSQTLKYNTFGEVTDIIRDTTNDTYEYDDEGRLTYRKIEDKDMGAVENRYTYDQRGNVTSIETGMGVEYIAYDKAGRVIKKENTESGISKTYSYYPTGYVKDIYTWQGEEVVYTESYEYDKNGNRTYENLNGTVKRYTYDGMGRLKSVTDGEGTIYEYEFDGYGNISREHEISEKGINTKQYFYDKNNRLILSDCDDETVQYEYDNAGNLIEKTTGFGGRIKKSYYTYDGYNRLSEYICDGVISEYTYNLEGLRESKKVGDKYTRFMYDGMNVIGELTNDNYYIYHRGTELIGYESFKGDSYYYRQDQHGNVTAVLDYTGKEIKTYSYNAYGEKDGIKIESAGDRTILYQWKAETERIHNPFGYCGEYTDDETGLIYLRNRYYDPTSGRFTQEDPIQDGLNWYAYCGDDPVNYVDPWGLLEDSDKRFKESNPIVYQSLVDLTKTWENLDSLEKSGVDIGNMKNEVHELANEVRKIGDNQIIPSTKVIFRDKVYKELTSTEAVFFYAHPVQGGIVGLSAENAINTTIMQYGHNNDSTIANAFQHALWNAASVALGASVEFTKLFANAHEYGISDNFSNKAAFDRTKMDLFNNSVGRYQGSLCKTEVRGMEAALRIKERADNDGLIYLEKGNP